MSLTNVILGFLEEPASGYDIKQSIDDSLSHLWAAESSQVYAKLRSMEADGLLSSVIQKSSRGPDRRVYTRTPKGEKALSDWLDGDPELSPERLSVLAQIHFLGRSRNPEKTMALLQRVRERFAERLKVYEAKRIAEQASQSDQVDAVFETLALDLGLKTLQARVEWCDEAIQRLMQLNDRGTSHA